MTKTIVCSQNWKKLKNELASESVQKKPIKRKLENGSKALLKKKLKKVDLTEKSKNKSTKSKKQSTKSPSTVNDESKSFPRKHSSANPLSNDSSTPDIWFDDVSMHDIIAAEKNNKSAKNVVSSAEQENHSSLVKSNASSGLTQTLGMKCALIGIGDRNESSVARVCIVNQFGKPVYDKYIEPQEPIKDYRTRINGIRQRDFENAEKFKVVQKEVSDIIKKRLLVGYHLHEDLRLLFLSHPKKSTIDITKHSACKSFGKARCASLKLLCLKLLKTDIQTTERNTMEDAQAAMKLYMVYKPQWYRRRFKIVQKRD